MSHTYMQAGSFQVSLTVTDSDGLSDTETMTVQSTTDLPSVSISVSPEQASYGLNASIDFTGNAMDIDGFIAHYEWDFGDGTSQGTDVEGELTTIDDVTAKSYSSPGNYSVFFSLSRMMREQ
ncbi:PKD domain-containing protein [Vibrio sinaloensis]|nr:PKD domain-containing protein [Vibrio sinaloensis]